MTQEDITRPWYKEFWTWFLIAIPLSSVIVGTIVFQFATDGTNSLVVDDYYKEGKTINARLDKIALAAEMNLVANLSFKEDSLVLSFTSGEVSGQALKLDFYHATQEHKDFEVILTRDAAGLFRGVIPQSIAGKWRLRLTPMDEAWKLQRMLSLPQQQDISLSAR